MHELPITQNILEICLRHAKNANADKISKINIVIGQLASVIDDSVLFYWEIIAKNTIAESATLEFTRIPAEFLCLNCESNFNWDQIQSNCPNCNSERIKLNKGTEFFIDYIDVG